MIRIINLILAVTFIFIQLISINTFLYAENTPKNIILMIGDGMGNSHIKAAKLAKSGKDGKLFMQKLEVQGYIRTLSANGEITDSAAAATAMATSTKTNNEIIGKDPDYNNLKNILEYAEKYGKSTGIVTTVQLTHATPAAFATHVRNRYKMEEIAVQIINKNIEVLFGGGENYFLPENQNGCFAGEGKRDDSMNLISKAVKNGYIYVCTKQELKNLDTGITNRVLGLFGAEEIKRPIKPNLTLLTKKAVEILSDDPDGFFLMVEAGQIDWASHENNAANMLNSMLQFDKAVKTAYQLSQTSETLLIVTSDHQTGKFKITPDRESLFADGPFYMPDGTKFFIQWNSDEHTADKVKIFASGVNAEMFNGTHENTFIFDVMYRSLKMKN